MKVKLLSIDKEYSLDDAGATLLIEDVTKAVAAVETRAATAETTVAEVKKVFGDDISADKLQATKTAAERGDVLFDQLLDEAVALNMQAEFTEKAPEKIKAQKELFAKLPVDAIRVQMGNAQKAIDLKLGKRPSQLDQENGGVPESDRSYAATY